MGEGLGTLVSPALSLPRHKKPSVAEVPTGEAAGTHSQAVRVADTLLWGCPALTTSPGTAQGWNHFPPAGGCSCSTPQLGVLLSHHCSHSRAIPLPTLSNRSFSSLFLTPNTSNNPRSWNEAATN